MKIAKLWTPDFVTDVTRLEVIDSKGRSYFNWKIKDIEFSLQDDDKTLKIFLRDNLYDE